jgi:predicted nucleic acid-binding protein
MIVLDTSVLIDSLTGPKRLATTLRGVIERGERMVVPTLVLYEWRRGPRLDSELAAQEALFPAESAIAFGPREAELSAGLYRSMRRPRGREIDLAIAATAIFRDAGLWTLNTDDFADIPQLRLFEPTEAS